MSELTWRTEFLKFSLFLVLNNVKQPKSEHVHLHAHVWCNVTLENQFIDCSCFIQIFCTLKEKIRWRILENKIWVYQNSYSYQSASLKNTLKKLKYSWFTYMYSKVHICTESIYSFSDPFLLSVVTRYWI